MTALPLKIATAPVNWNNNDLPGWRELVPFPVILDLMRQAGYTATEYDAKFGLDPVVVRKEVAAHGMTLCGSYQWLDLLDTDIFASQLPMFRDRLVLLRALQCDNVIIADKLRSQRVAIAGNVPTDGSVSLATDGYRRIGENAQRAAAIAREYGIATHYHNHVGTWIETPAEVDALLRCLMGTQVDLCFDTGHYAYGGGDAAAFVAQHCDDIGYVHLKDVDESRIQAAKAESWNFLDALRHIVFAPLGQGSADIRRILDVLRQKEFAGWVVVEQDTCAGDRTAVAQKNLDFVKDALNSSPHTSSHSEQSDESPDAKRRNPNRHAAAAAAPGDP